MILSKRLASLFQRESPKFGLHISSDILAQPFQPVVRLPLEVRQLMPRDTHEQILLENMFG